MAAADMIVAHGLGCPGSGTTSYLTVGNNLGDGNFVLVAAQAYDGSSADVTKVEWGDGTNWTEMTLVSKARETVYNTNVGVSAIYRLENPTDYGADNQFRFTSAASWSEGLTAEWVTLRDVDTSSPIIDSFTDVMIGNNTAQTETLTGGSNGDFIWVVGESYTSFNVDLDLQSQTVLDVQNTTACNDQKYAHAYKDWSAGATAGIGNSDYGMWGCVAVKYSAAGAATYNDTISEGVTLGESHAAGLVLAASLSEGLTLGDSLIVGLLYTDLLSEGTTLSVDYAAAVVLDIALSEGLTLDVDFAAAQTLVDTLTEGVTLGDGLTAGLLLEAALAETTTLGDDFVSTVTKDETLTESVTLGDDFAATLITAGAVSEGVTLADSVAAAAVYPVALSEDVVLDVPLVDEHIQGGVYNDTLNEVLTLGDSYSTSLVAATVLTEGLTLDTSFYTPPLGQSVRSGGGGGGGRAWGWELDREVEEEMGALLEGPPLTPATIEAVARRLDAPAESRIIGLKQPPVPAVSFEAAMVRRRRIRRRLLLLL